MKKSPVLLLFVTLSSCGLWQKKSSSDNDSPPRSLEGVWIAESIQDDSELTVLEASSTIFLKVGSDKHVQMVDTANIGARCNDIRLPLVRSNNHVVVEAAEGCPKSEADIAEQTDQKLVLADGTVAGQAAFDRMTFRKASDDDFAKVLRQVDQVKKQNEKLNTPLPTVTVPPLPTVSIISRVVSAEITTEDLQGIWVAVGREINGYFYAIGETTSDGDIVKDEKDALIFKDGFIGVVDSVTAANPEKAVYRSIKIELNHVTAEEFSAPGSNKIFPGFSMPLSQHDRKKGEFVRGGLGYHKNLWYKKSTVEEVNRTFGDNAALKKLLESKP